MTESTTPSRDVRGSHRAAGVLTLVEALVLLGFTVFFGYETATGATTTTATAVSSSLLILVFAVGLGALAWGWSRGAGWPRTPTVLWNALLLPVAWSLHDAGRTGPAIAVAVLAVASIVSALRAPSRRTFGEEGPGGPEDSNTQDE